MFKKKHNPNRENHYSCPKNKRKRGGKIWYNITMTRGEQGIEEGEFCSWNTWEAHVGTFMQISNTVAPQAIEADLRGSENVIFFSSPSGSAWTSSLFSIISFLIWFSRSWKYIDHKSIRTQHLQYQKRISTKILVAYLIIKARLSTTRHQKWDVRTTAGCYITSHSHNATRKCPCLKWRRRGTEPHYKGIDILKSY